MFQIKICGLKSEADAQVAVEAGADAIGLNFYEESCRCIGIEQAAAIAGSLPKEVMTIGVFVNSPAQQINEIASSVGLDAIQLHGDEPPSILAELSGSHTVLRARRWNGRGGQEITDDLLACAELGGRSPDAVLLDAAVAGQFGGTGNTLPWDKLKEYPQWLGETPLILAGGLNPANVVEAILAVHPHGVDVASGVESSPGIKDHNKIRDFVQAASSALSED